MLSFNADIDRRNTLAFKWDKYAARPGILPCWIADSEFAIAEPIQRALQERVTEQALGYTLPSMHRPANEAVQRWCEYRYQWSVDTPSIVWNPGVVPAFNVAVRMLKKASDRVIVQTPNYPPLLTVCGNHQNPCDFLESIEVDGRYIPDFTQLERLASHADAKLFILCNPMNPTGSVLTPAELDRIADICERHDVILCSDEIHCDLILDGSAHVPASSHPKLKDRSITLMAASKTFNIAGLGTSFSIIPNPKLRAAFTQAANGLVPWANVLGLVATSVAFTQCDTWHQQELSFLKENRDLLSAALRSNDELRFLTPQATFLQWVVLKDPVVDGLSWAENRGIGPSPGADFGQKHAFRVNFGCTRDQLHTLIDRLTN